MIKKNLTVVLILAAVLLLVGGFFAYQKFFASKGTQTEVAAEEVDLPFDAEGPYALLIPRRDGNALILNLKRTASYDKISYELAYNAEGIDRGVMGDINTKEKKGEYEQEILFGTCSKNVCKYDKGVENGTLTLHIRKGAQAYRMVMQWHLQQPDIALGVLSAGDNHFTYKADPNSPSLPVVKYTIINDLSGAPKLPSDKTILGKVYAFNTPVAKSMPAGTVTVELIDNPAPGSKIARFDESENKWVEYDTKISGSTLTAVADDAGIFTVLTPKK